MDTEETLANMMAEIKLTAPQYRTCLVYDDKMKLHQTEFEHPEKPERISRIFEKHQELGLIDRCQRLPSRYATTEEIAFCHNIEYIKIIEKTKNASHNLKKFDSVYFHEETYRSACLAVGCVLNVVDEVLGGKCVNGTAIVRPPGHHAEVSTACGFCFFNNVAIAAKYAQEFHDAKRVLIVDWDVHHGNGIQNMFVNDSSVLYVSLHRYDDGNFYPGSSRAEADKVGLKEGAGFNINIAWNWAKMGDAEYLAAFQQIIMPIAYEFSPDLVLVSAGFDAALGDPLGKYLVSPDGYGQMTHMLSSLASGRVIIVLEGGYNMTSISNSMARCTQTLLGDPCPVLNAGPPNQHALNSIQNTLQCHKPYWKCLQFQKTLPVAPIQDSNSENLDNSADCDRNMTTRIRASASSTISVDDVVESTSEMSISSCNAGQEAVSVQPAGVALHKIQPDGSPKEFLK